MKKIYQVGYYNPEDEDSFFTEFNVIKTFEDAESADAFRKNLCQEILLGRGMYKELDIDMLEIHSFNIDHTNHEFVNKHVECLLFIYFNRFCGGSPMKPCRFKIRPVGYNDMEPDIHHTFDGKGILAWLVEYDPDKKYPDYITQEMYNFLRRLDYDEQAKDLMDAANKNFAITYRR